MIIGLSRGMITADYVLLPQATRPDSNFGRRLFAALTIERRPWGFRAAQIKFWT